MNLTFDVIVIGAGIMGERLLGAIVLQDPALVHACGIWDPSPDAMRRMERTFPNVPRMSDAASVIAAGDCIYVASPPASHLGHARAALAAGKSFFGEKPLAVDVADARAFVAEAGNRGAVNFPFASSFAVAALRDWIASGEIGTPQRIDIDVGFKAWPRPWQALTSAMIASTSARLSTLGSGRPFLGASTRREGSSLR